MIGRPGQSNVFVAPLQNLLIGAHSSGPIARKGGWHSRLPSWSPHHLAPNRRPPTGTPDVALNNILEGYWSNAFADFGALRANGSISRANPFDKSTLDDYWSKRARQAYWAALSFTDENVGVVVQGAKAAGLFDEAVVLFWGDHGYALVSSLRLLMRVDQTRSMH